MKLNKQFFIHWPLGDVALILKVYFLNSLYRIVELSLCVKLLSGECHKNSLIETQYWFSYWLASTKQQAITWANLDPDLCHHMVSLSRNDFKQLNMYTVNEVLKDF